MWTGVACFGVVDGAFAFDIQSLSSGWWTQVREEVRKVKEATFMVIPTRVLTIPVYHNVVLAVLMGQTLKTH